MSQTLSVSTLLAVPLLPLAGAVLAGVFGTVFGGNWIGRRLSHTLTILGVLLAFILSAMTLKSVAMDGAGFNETLYTWMVVGGLKMEVGFVKLVEWTFDPLQLKNAFFNIERLGAVVRRYVLNQYGVSSSPLQAGLPTDRCIVEWALESKRVNYLVDGAGSYQQPSAVAKIAVPNAISEIAKKEPARALELQASISEQFMRHLSNGLAVTGFERGELESSYLLAPWEGNE